MKLINLMIAWVMIVAPVMGIAQTPTKFQTDILQFGRGSTLLTKDLIFDSGDGASNKKLSLDPNDNEFDLTSSLNITGNLGTSGNVNATGNVSGIDLTGTGNLDVTGTSTHKSGITIGLGTDTSKSITMDRAGFDPYMKWDESLDKWVFSNDGSLEKPLGSGSGNGSGGINILVNSSFEDGLGSFTSSGGTLTQQSYTNAIEGNAKFARFVASGSGQYVETVLTVVPDFLGSGCQAQFEKYATINDGAWKISVLDGSANVLATQNFNQSGGASVFIASPLLAFPCPAAAATFKVRIESLAAATIDLDLAYGGGNKNDVAVVCQGTAGCEDIFSAKVSATGVVSDENLEWINGNFSVASPALTGTFNSGIFTVAPNCTTSAIFVGGFSKFVYDTVTTSSTVVVRGSDNAATPAITGFHIVCQKQGADFVKAKPIQAVTSEQSGWFIDANIGGGNATLSASDVSSYTGIESTSFDMVLNPGSATARIACSGTNASTGLTCAAGSESVSVNIPSLPYSGYFDVCADFSHITQMNGTGSKVESAFQLVETTNATQTIIQEGKTRTMSYSQNDLSAANTLGNGGAIKNCGTFYFSNVAEKTIRLMYEQDVTATVTGNNIVADRAAAVGQRDIHITVRPSTMNIARPVLTGDQVTQTGSSNPVSYRAELASNGTVNKEHGTFINGNCTNATPQVCTFESTAFKSGSDVICEISDGINSTSSFYPCYLHAIPTSSSVSIRCSNVSQIDSTLSVSKIISCHGSK